MSHPFRLLLLVMPMLAGCGGADEPATRSAPSEANTDLERPASAAVAEGRTYAVDAAASEVLWRISKAGLMARFGHNHVISAEQFDGRVVVADDPARSRFELEFPVASLVVDDPALRARFGEEFASVPTEADKEGTRTNMLGDGVLRASMFPTVRVTGGAPSGEVGAETLPIRIEILGNAFDFRVPGAVTVGDDTLEASGEFALVHADLGMTPFSALGGALQVGERIEFTYRIRAVATTDDR